MSAGEQLVAAVVAALEPVGEIGGVYDGTPLQAAFPYAVVEVGPELDWSHKSGAGREVRLAITVRDQGERPARLRRLLGEAEAAAGAVGGDIGGWRVVTFQLVRSRVVREPRGPWAGLVEFRARMLAA